MAQTVARAPAVYDADGATSVFNIPWSYDDAAKVRVALIDPATGIERYQTSPAITISAPSATVRTVTFASAPSAPDKVVIWPDDDGRQTVSFADLKRLPAENMERMGDRAARQTEALFQILRRAMRLPMNENGPFVIPSASARASRVLSFGEDGDPKAGPLMTDLDALGERIAALKALSEPERLAALDAILADIEGAGTIADAAALLAVAAPGLVAKDAAGTPVSRAITSGSAGLVITNGNGASGNPTFNFAASYQRAAAGGLAPLDSNGLVPDSHIPPLAISSVKTYADIAERDAAENVQEGDVAIVTDAGDGLTRSYIRTGAGSWKEIVTPGGVSSVAGKTGAVSLTRTDVGLGNVDNTPDADKPISTDMQAALALKLDASVLPPSSVEYLEAFTLPGAAPALASFVQHNADGTTQFVQLGDLGGGDMLNADNLGGLSSKPAARANLEIIDGTLDPDTALAIRAMSVNPSPAQALAYDGLIRDLKAAGIWSKLGFLLALNAHDGQAGRVNLVDPSVVFTVAGSPVHTPGAGWAGNGVDGALYGPQWASIANLEQDDNGLFAMVVGGTDAPNTNNAALAQDTGSGRFSIFPRNDFGAFVARTSQNTVTSVASSTIIGFFAAYRYSATNVRMYRDGARVLTVSDLGSQGTGTSNIALLANASNFGDLQLAFAGAGGSLTDAENADLYDILTKWRAVFAVVMDQAKASTGDVAPRRLITVDTTPADTPADGDVNAKRLLENGVPLPAYVTGLRGLDLGDHGATVGGGNDDTSAIEAWIAAASPGDVLTVRQPGFYGVKAITNGRAIPAGVQMHLHPEAVFEVERTDTGGSGNERVFQWNGTRGTAVDLTSDAAPGADSIVVANGDEAQFEPGMLVKLTTNYKWDPNRTNINDGELAIVRSVAAGTINLKGPIRSLNGYKTSESAKIIPFLDRYHRPGVFGGQFRAAVSSSTSNELDAVRFLNAFNPKVHGTFFEGMDRAALQYLDCWKPEAFFIEAHNSVGNTQAYGVSFADACRDGLLWASEFINCRHAIATNNTSAEGGVTDGTRAYHNTIDYSSTALGGSMTAGDAMDAHAGSRDSDYSWNVIRNAEGAAILMEGHGGKAASNRIYNPGRFGVIMQNFTRQQGAVFQIWDNLIDGPDRANAGWHAIQVTNKDASGSVALADVRRNTTVNLRAASKSLEIREDAGTIDLVRNEGNIWSAASTTKQSIAAQSVIDDNNVTDAGARLDRGSFVPFFDLVAAPTYSAQSGKFRRVGDIVYFDIFMAWSGLDTTDISIVVIGGLPFPAAAAQRGMANIDWRASSGFSMTAGDYYQPTFYSSDLSALHISNIAGTRLTYNGGRIQAAGSLYITGWYFIS